MLITRIYNDLENIIEPNKVIVIYGPRRVGKTTLINQFLKKTNLEYRFDIGDNIEVQRILSSQSFEKIKQYVGSNQLIVIDEAHRHRLCVF